MPTKTRLDQIRFEEVIRTLVNAYGPITISYTNRNWQIQNKADAVDEFRDSYPIIGKAKTLKLAFQRAMFGEDR